MLTEGRGGGEGGERAGAVGVERKKHPMYEEGEKRGRARVEGGGKNIKQKQERNVPTQTTYGTTKKPQKTYETPLIQHLRYAP